MKKWLIAFCMTLCLLGLTACGQKESEKLMSDSDAIALGESAVSLLQQVTSQGMEETYIAQVEYSGENGQVYKNAFESWNNAAGDMGTYLGIGKMVSNNMKLDALDYPKEGSVEIELLGSDHDATLEIVIERGNISAITTNVNYSFGENMKKAGLNTLLGMGTVFVVLILISFIISAFNLIPKIQAAFSKKPETPTEKSVDQTIAQIVENEELNDDLELVAVIAAAIASYENTSTDGFTVRSIRRAR